MECQIVLGMPGPRETSLGAKKMIEPQCEIPQATAALQLSRFLGRNGKGYIVMYHLLLMFPQMSNHCIASKK